MEARHTALPTQASGNALQLCDASTGHCVSNVAFCDTPERAAAIVRACNSFDELVAACQHFVDQVESGRARSTKNYQQMKAALTKVGAA